MNGAPTATPLATIEQRGFAVESVGAGLSVKLVQELPKMFVCDLDLLVPNVVHDGRRLEIVVEGLRVFLVFGPNPVFEPHIQKWVIFVHRRPCVCDTFRFESPTSTEKKIEFGTDSLLLPRADYDN